MNSALNTLLVGTRKGLVVYSKKDGQWNHSFTHFDAIPVNAIHVDEVNNSWWVGLNHGHWGAKFHRSLNQGKSWEELSLPSYKEGEVGSNGKPAAFGNIWSLQNNSQGELWIGAEPGGLFKRVDDNYSLNEGLWNLPSRKDPTQWFGGGLDVPMLHSIEIDPRDENHFYVGISCAGVFETQDGGESWTPRNNGLEAEFLTNPSAEIGHDPHRLLMSPSNPDVLWQQNHCGVYRSMNGGLDWEDVSGPNRDPWFGFGIVVDQNDENRAWVIPGINDEMRMPINRALKVCETQDGGKSWRHHTRGLPQENAFDIVLRHAFVGTGEELIFGTSTGNLFSSSDYGESWSTVSNFLADIYCLYAF